MATAMRHEIALAHHIGEAKTLLPWANYINQIYTWGDGQSAFMCFEDLLDYREWLHRPINIKTVEYFECRYE